MGRVASRVRSDEVRRLVKPLLDLGLSVKRVRFTDEGVCVDIGEVGEKVEVDVDAPPAGEGLIREPQL